LSVYFCANMHSTLICLLHLLFSKDIIKDRGIEINSLDKLQDYFTLSDDEMGSNKRKGFHLVKRTYEFRETDLKNKGS
ncbi:MAG: hypothetical protein KAU23_06310, partial [Anaerolineales bacterium]|nr:hypothetical protein [Anaerolineales bacterium]